MASSTGSKLRDENEGVTVFFTLQKRIRASKHGCVASVVSAALVLACGRNVSLAIQKPSLSLRSVNSTAGRDENIALLQALLLRSQWAEAEKLATVMVKKNPSNPIPYYGLGIARWRMDDPVGTIRALRRAEGLGLNSDNLHKLLGLAYYRLHQFFLFKLEMNRALQVDPNDYEAYYSLGRYSISNDNNYTGALSFLRKAVELKPDFTRGIYYLGYCEERLGHDREAQTDYERAIALAKSSHNKFSLPFQGMARLLLWSNAKEAAHFAQMAVQREPQVDSNHFVLAQADEQLGQLPEAAQELLTAVRLNPTKSSYHYVLFKLYSRMGKDSEAQGQLREVEKLNALYNPD